MAGTENQNQWANRHNEAGLWEYLLVGFIILYYLGGFLFTDPIIERQLSDETHFHYEVIKLFANAPLHEAVKDYPSATMPLYHIIYSFFYEYFSSDVEVLRLVNLAIIFLTAGLLYFYFSRLKKHSPRTVIILTALFLSSPFLRGSGFALTTDNLPFFFLTLSLILFEYGLARKLVGLFALSMFFAFCAFYVRQFYFWLPFYLFFCCLPEIKKKKHQFLFFISNLAFFLPAIYLRITWGGMVPPMWQSSFQSSNILMTLPFAFAMFPIYYYPMIVYHRKEILKNANNQNVIFCLCLCAAYVLIYSFSGFKLNIVSGGISPKAFLVFPPALGTALFLIFSFSGAGIVAWYLSGSLRKNYYLILIIFGLSLSLFLFQRYADPILYMAIFLFSGKKADSGFMKSNYLYLFILAELFFFAGSIFYYDSLA